MDAPMASVLYLIAMGLIAIGIFAIWRIIIALSQALSGTRKTASHQNVKMNDQPGGDEERRQERDDLPSYQPDQSWTFDDRNPSSPSHQSPDHSDPGAPL